MPKILNSNALIAGITGFIESPFSSICRVHFFSSDPTSDPSFIQPTGFGPMATDVSMLPGFVDTYSYGMGSEDVSFGFGPPGTLWNESIIDWALNTGSSVTITHIIVQPYYDFEGTYACIQLDEPKVTGAGEKIVFFKGQIVLSLQNPD